MLTGCWYWFQWDKCNLTLMLTLNNVIFCYEISHRKWFEVNAKWCILQQINLIFLPQRVRFTAFSELLPLLAAGSIPLVKVEKISQGIDTSNFTIENSTALSSPVATLSFSATATFEVRSPSRIQVPLSTTI